jgi:hypothetical protein
VSFSSCLLIFDLQASALPFYLIAAVDRLICLPFLREQPFLLASENYEARGWKKADGV